MLDIVGGFNGPAKTRQWKSHVNIKRERAEKLRDALRELSGRTCNGADALRLYAASELLDQELAK